MKIFVLIAKENVRAENLLYLTHQIYFITKKSNPSHLNHVSSAFSLAQFIFFSWLRLRTKKMIESINICFGWICAAMLDFQTEAWLQGAIARDLKSLKLGHSDVSSSYPDSLIPGRTIRDSIFLEKYHLRIRSSVDFYFGTMTGRVPHINGKPFSSI